MAMFPHERSLVERLKNQPFALIGVNTDQDLKQAHAQLKTDNITWRSFYDGPGGAICKQYKVNSFPTLILIDGNGVIRKTGPALRANIDGEVEKLLAELR